MAYGVLLIHQSLVKMVFIFTWNLLEAHIILLYLFHTITTWFHKISLRGMGLSI